LASLEQFLAMKLAAGRARDQADITALGNGAAGGPGGSGPTDSQGIRGEALEVMTKLEDVTHDAQALIPERPPN
jgi:hypothetical protein